MFGRTRQNRMESIRDALGEAVAYTDDLVQDKRLRSHVRSAVDHGAFATKVLRHDGSFSSRMAADKKLRKHLEALLDDIERVGDRMRRKRSHRVRNALLIVAGSGAVVAVVPNARRWVVDRMPASRNGGLQVDATVAGPEAEPA